MASSLEFAELVAEKIYSAGSINYRKMFGEYMVYCNGKPIFLICNDTLYAKVLKETTEIVGENNEQGAPYNGARQHYIVDVDNDEIVLELARALERITPLPKPKKKKVK